MDIDRRISPNEQMLVPGRTEHYFAVGASALAAVRLALAAAGREPGEVRSILDLPCGHGRVLRWLAAAFPRASLTACDLSGDGVRFCAETFGAAPVVSAVDPVAIPIEPDRFDLVFVGSLLTHLDAPRWPPFLAFLCSRLAPGGVLVATTHGRGAVEQIERGTYDYGLPEDECTAVLRAYHRTGFGYADYPGVAGYGVSLSALGWACDRLLETPDVTVVHASERAWDDHQDVLAAARR